MWCWPVMLRGGIEGAIHAVRELFEDKAEDGYGVLMVDARNAFNSVNRVVGLWNALAKMF